MAADAANIREKPRSKFRALGISTDLIRVNPPHASRTQVLRQAGAFYKRFMPTVQYK